MVNPDNRLLYGIGLLVLLFLIYSIVRVLLPWLIAAGLGVSVFLLWKRWRSQIRSEESQLNQIFYDFLRQHQGRISALDFAMTANLSPQKAKAYLNVRAKEFSALFEPTDYGDVLYRFYSLTIPPPSPVAPPLQIQKMSLESDASTALSPAALARRFELSTEIIHRRKQTPDFLDWSKLQDPEGIAWRYSISDRAFYPVRAVE
ncbi:MAG: hypothetical protein F6K04_24700 [Leptolyngbya sp. SIO4C5]|nr:hypothetical protein [Leptolyngbya sp. SIO4C5]